MSGWISGQSDKIEQADIKRRREEELRYNHEHGEHGQFASGGGGNASQKSDLPKFGSDIPALRIPPTDYSTPANTWPDAVAATTPPGGTAGDGTPRASAAEENAMAREYPHWEIIWDEYDTGWDKGTSSGQKAGYAAQNTQTDMITREMYGDDGVSLGELRNQMDSMISDPENSTDAYGTPMTK